MITDDLAPWGFVARQVHQAEGVLSARLDISVPDAVATLRTMADRAEAPLVDVAQDVLAGLSPAD